MPIQYIIQAPNFEKIMRKDSQFMEQANKNETFSNVDVNLKFNKPEINVTIDREKAESLGISGFRYSSNFTTFIERSTFWLLYERW